MKSCKLGSGVGHGHRRLAVESLEQRAMLAGNVNVFVSGGSLFVRGNNADNFVLIQEIDDGDEDANTHAYLVTGLDFGDTALPDPPFGSGPTTINGDLEAQEFTGVTGNIDVDLRNGDDVILIGNSEDELLALADDCGLGIGFGDGSPDGSAIAQQLDGEFLVVPRNLIINTGNGSDGVVVNADVTNSAIINTGAGNDAVAFGNSEILEAQLGEGERFEGSTFVGDDLIVNTGNGDDLVCAHTVTVHDHINIQTGAGADDVLVSDFIAQHMLVVTGNHSDLVEINFFDLDRELIIDTGAGNDGVFVNDFTAGQGNGPLGTTGSGNVVVVTGAGNDDVELIGFDASSVVVNTGAGNDGSPSGESPITIADAEIFTDQNGNNEFDETSEEEEGEEDSLGNITMVTGAGNDLVSIQGVDARSIVVDTGAGNDGSDLDPISVSDVFLLNQLVLATGAGNDFAAVVDSTIGDLVVNLGAGNDDLLLDSIAIGRDSSLVLGAGNDSLLSLNSTVGRNALANAGAGNDTVTIENNSVGETATIFMGAGNDTLNSINSIAKKVRAFGGSGRDTLNNDLGIDANGDYDFGVATAEIREFEEFNSPG